MVGVLALSLVLGCASSLISLNRAVASDPAALPTITIVTSGNDRLIHEADLAMESLVILLAKDVLGSTRSYQRPALFLQELNDGGYDGIVQPFFMVAGE